MDGLLQFSCAGGVATQLMDDGKADLREWPQMFDAVEKVAPLPALRQNISIGRWGISQHDGTVIEWTESTVLLVQP